MTDKETLDTLEAASKAQDTGDGKRQVFTADASKGEHPEPPYDTGDLWFNGEDILVCTVARTASDKYNASDWVKKDSYASKNDMKDYVDGVTKDMQDQIDSKAEQHFYAYDPTPDNEPANSWTTDEEKEKHVDDLFYNTETGKAYRFMKGDDGSYKWELVQDEDVTNALEAASKAQDTADGKRRVFTADASKDEHPDPPYDEGDLWYTGAEVLVCGKPKAKGEAYDAGDWGKKDNYTNKDEVIDTVDKKLTQEDIFNRLTNNGASQGMFIEDGNVYFNASYIATGMLTSQNKNSVYNLADGTFTITNEHSDPAPNVVTKTVLTPDGLEVYTANNLSFELKNHHNQNLGDWARMKLGDDNNYIIFDPHEGISTSFGVNIYYAEGTTGNPHGIEIKGTAASGNRKISLLDGSVTCYDIDFSDGDGIGHIGSIYGAATSDSSEKIFTIDFPTTQVRGNMQLFSTGSEAPSFYVYDGTTNWGGQTLGWDGSKEVTTLDADTQAVPFVYGIELVKNAQGYVTDVKLKQHGLRFIGGILV